MGEFKEKFIKRRATLVAAGSLAGIAAMNAIFPNTLGSFIDTISSSPSKENDTPSDINSYKNGKIPFRASDCNRFDLKLFENKIGKHIDDKNGHLPFYIDHFGREDLDPTDFDERRLPTISFRRILEEGNGERTWYIQKEGQHNIIYRDKSTPFDRFSAHIDVRRLTASSANVSGYVCNDILREVLPQRVPGSIPTESADISPNM